MNVRIVIKSNNKWLSFCRPDIVLTARDTGEVREALNSAHAASLEGKYAVGFAAYEAAAAFDDSLKTHQSGPGALPLVWFAVFEKYEQIELPRNNTPLSLEWKADTEKQEYTKSINEIKKQIRKGNTYQVNYTIRQTAEFSIEPFELFSFAASSSEAEYCCFIETDNFAVCSFSPELFFKYDNGTVVTRPVKGTARRALTAKDDIEVRKALQNCKKNTAENVMIVDMLRNDLGTIAEPGSVKVEKLFEIETYPTLHQLSSTITAHTGESAAEVFKHLFPCASITGAPKCRTMEIIAALEKSPRGIYTGAIGSFTPGGNACFNVAIRTAEIDKLNSTARYGVGGGIVWDSTAEGEYEECITKTAVLTRESEKDFSLLESILWNREKGFWLLERHLTRLQESAAYFGFKYDRNSIIKELQQNPPSSEGDFKIRLLLSKDGGITIESDRITLSNVPLKLRISSDYIESDNKFLYHKTTCRDVYRKAFEARGDCDEVLLWNEKGQITEGTYHNVIFEKNGRLFTPPVSCGLLDGVMRQQMLDEGKITERAVTLEELKSFDAIWLINSVRGMRKAYLEK